MRLLTISLLVVTGFGLAACDDDDVTGPDIDFDDDMFEQFDLNDDDLLDEDEFGLAFANAEVFTQMDQDGDMFLDDDELLPTLGTVADYDTDDDGLLDEDEFVAGMFDLFDANEDSFVDEEEFEDGEDMF